MAAFCVVRLPDIQCTSLYNYLVLFVELMMNVVVSDH